MPFKHGAKIGPVLIAGLALPGVAQANEHAAHAQPGPGVSVSASAEANGHGSGAGNSGHGNSSWSNAGGTTAPSSGLTCSCTSSGGHANGHAGGHAEGAANGNAVVRTTTHSSAQANGH